MKDRTSAGAEAADLWHDLVDMYQYIIVTAEVVEMPEISVYLS